MTVEEVPTQTDLFGGERRPNATELLTTLALINVNWEVDRRSYLDNFVPFLVEAIRAPKVHGWSEAEAQAQLERTFGLAVPTKVVGSLLRRAARRGLAVRDNNRYTLTTESRGDGLAPVAAARADCRRQQRNLASAQRCWSTATNTGMTARFRAASRGPVNPKKKPTRSGP